MSNHWDAQAACKGRDIELWFSDSEEEIEAAKWACHDCPVKQFCFDEAMAHNLTGIWGGTTDRERNRIRRARRVRDDSLRKQFCKNKHEFTPENTYVRPNGDRQCRTCTRLRKRAKAAAKPPKPLATHCKRGHEWLPATTYMDPRGVRICRLCRQLTNRARKERRRGMDRSAVA